MAFVHGKNTEVDLDGNDLSAYCNNTEWSREADTHDTTTYGKDSKTYEGGLKDGTVTISGTYDNTASTGPKAVIEPLLGTKVPFVMRPEGTGTGRPERTVDVVVSSYEETLPVADMITWSAELQLSDDVTDTAQI